MLRLDALTLIQGDFRLTANWTLPAGAKLALIGPSGAGKSTLLAAIAGFLAPTSGRILWDGTDLGPQPPGARPLTILFQDHNLFPHLDVTRNLALGLTPARRLSPDQRARVDTALAQVGLDGFGARRPGDLSGGQQSRAALARALLRDRPMLLLDEPFAALGPGQRAQMQDLVTETAAGRSVLMVTHDPAEARRFADLTSFVDGGIAHALRPTADLFADPPAGLRSYLGL